jgi:hypothetical protein
LVRFFIDLFQVKRGIKKKTGGPAWSSRFMENVNGLTYVATDFDFAGLRSTCAATVNAWRKLASVTS